MRIKLTLALAVMVSGAAALPSLAGTAHAIEQLPPITSYVDGVQAGTIRAAITAANASVGASTMEIPAGVFTLDIAGALEDLNASGDLDITQPLSIVGAGPDATIIDAQSIGERAFEVLGGGQLTLTNLTIRNGSTSGNGGAIRVGNASVLTLSAVHLDSNKAVGDGGAIATNGGFHVLSSSFAGNKATGAGSIGGGLRFFGNAAGAYIANSTFSANTAADGGALAGSSQQVIILASTFSGNQASTHSALLNFGGVSPSNSWLLSHATITNNTDVSGGALAATGNGSFLFADSIVAGNTGGQCNAAFVPQGTDIISDTSCGAASSKLTVLAPGQSPGLYPLADNGGGTKTHAVKFDSPVLNTTTCQQGEMDQRNIVRPFAALQCDAGAYERTIVAVDDPGQTAVGGTPTDIDVYANDPGTDGYTLGSPIAGGSATIATQPAHGTAAFVSTHVVYTPAATYSGADTFTYTICVAQTCSTATVSVTVTAAPVLPPAVLFPDAAQYTAIPPTRILDTRTGAKPAPGSTTILPVAGVAGVPTTGVVAVVLNVTATEATAPGFVTVFPSGSALPTVSNLNLEYAGETIPNLVTVPVGADGTVSLFTQSGAHLLADIAGYYRTATDRKAGRFEPVTPARLLDTRTTHALGADSSVDLTVTGVGGVPSAASAVVLNVTATNAAGAGYLTVWPAGSARPVVSNLNINHAGQTIANLVIVPVGPGGTISLYSQSGADIVVDITGWYTDGSAAVSNRGLFEARPPIRVLDTRTDHPFAAGESRSLPITLVGSELAVVLNVTATASAAPGYITVWPTGITMPFVSNLNVENVGQTIPNSVIVGVGPSNSVSLFAQSGTHLVVDLSGYFTLG